MGPLLQRAYKETVGTKDVQLNASYQADFFDNGLKTSMTFQKDASAQAANIGLSYWGNRRHYLVLSQVHKRIFNWVIL